MSCFMYSAFYIFDIVAYAPGWLSAVRVVALYFQNVFYVQMDKEEIFEH